MAQLVAMLRRMNWVTRHEYWAKFKANTQLQDAGAVKHVYYTMGPDELLDGRGEGFTMPPLMRFVMMPIPLPDKVRRGKRQLTLHDFWKVRPKKKKQRKSKDAWKQRTLFHYWKPQ